MPAPLLTSDTARPPARDRFALRLTGVAAAALWLLSACGGGGGGDSVSLKELPVEGTPGAVGRYAARSPGGHYHLLSNYSVIGSQFYLPRGGKAWVAVTPNMRQFLPPQPDHRVYGLDNAGTLHRLDDSGWTPLLPPANSGLSTPLGRRLDGQHVQYGNDVNTGLTTFYQAAEGGSWSVIGWVTLPWVNIRPVHMTATGRILTWEDHRGLVEVDPVAHTTTLIAGCDAPSMTESCNATRTGIPDRQGNFYYLNLSEATGYQIELWKLAPGSNTPEKVAGPKLPELPRSVDGAFNAYGGPTSLYADKQGRIWMSLRWGDNSFADTNYLYRSDGGGWDLLKKGVLRNAQFFGEGDLPGVLALSDFGAVRVFQLE